MKRGFVAFLFLLILVGGSYLRFTGLSSRVMHTDEAVHAIKVIELERAGYFEYDPKDYHGPTLHYSTLWLRPIFTATGFSKAQKSIGMDEADLRKVVAIYSVILLCLLGAGMFALSYGRLREKGPLLFAMLLMALSPMALFYSRYYIMEVLLLCFTLLFLSSLWRVLHGGQIGWVILCGVSMGLMHATKETALLTWFSVAAATLFLRGAFPLKIGSEKFWRKLLVTGISALATSALFYSDFGKNWNDVLESYLCYFDYFSRSGGSGHEKPFWYYSKLLTLQRDGFYWGELLVTLLALYAAICAWLPAPPNCRDKAWRSKPRVSLLHWLSLSALFLFFIYSAIPYKTPWSLLSVHLLLVILAGYGACMLSWPLRRGGWVCAQAGLVLLMFFGLWQFYQQGQRANGPYSSDPRNPYVYSHSSWQVKDLVSKLKQQAEQKPGLAVQIYQQENAWPLPWYLRQFDKVGYQAEAPAGPIDADVVIYDIEWKEEVESNLSEDFLSRPAALKALRPERFVEMRSRLTQSSPSSNP